MKKYIEKLLIYIREMVNLLTGNNEKQKVLNYF